MVLSVNLAEDAIVVVLGKAGKRLVIEDCHRYILPQGTLINDVITDEKQFKSVLEEVKHRYDRYSSRVHLVLGSIQIVTKMMQIPPLSKRQILYLVRQELEHYKGEDMDLVYDYGVVRRKNRYNQGGIILAASIEREKIKGYTKLFEECGMKVKTIDVAMNAAVNLIERLPALEGGTYILSVLDGRNMLSVLYIDGSYVHTGRSRFLHDRDSREFVEEMQEEIQALMDFSKFLGAGKFIETVYFCGLSLCEKEYLNMKGDDLEEPWDIQIAHGLEYQLKDYIYATGNLYGKIGVRCCEIKDKTLGFYRGGKA